MTASSARPLRGQIWEFDLNPKKGREQEGVVVCPITTRNKPAFGWRPGLTPEDLDLVDPSWSAHPHWIMTDQIVTVDAGHRSLRHLATIARQERVAELDDSLRLILGLR